MTPATRDPPGELRDREGGNYVTRNPPHLGNFVIAHTELMQAVERLAALAVHPPGPRGHNPTREGCRREGPLMSSADATACWKTPRLWPVRARATRRSPCVGSWSIPLPMPQPEVPRCFRTGTQ